MEKGSKFYLPQFVDGILDTEQRRFSVVLPTDVEAPAETADQPWHGRNSCHLLGCSHEFSDQLFGSSLEDTVLLQF